MEAFSPPASRTNAGSSPLRRPPAGCHTYPLAPGDHAAAQQGTAAALTFAAAGCFTLMLAMTLALNMPINLAVFRWDEGHGDPDRWQQPRRRWDLIHTGRVVLERPASRTSASAWSSRIFSPRPTAPC